MNSLAVSSKRVRELKENEIVAEVNMSLPELAAFMSKLLREKTVHNPFKISLGWRQPLIV